MKRPMTLILLAGVVLFCTLSGCRTVTFTPVVEGMAYPPKSDNHEIVVLEPAEAGQYDIIGSVSFQDSALSHMWNGWQDLKSLGEELEFENIERLMEKVREVGGDALIGLQHEGMIGQGPTRAHTTSETIPNHLPN